jgi:ribosome assembly protein RRB1
MSKRAAVEAESLDGQSFSKTRQSAKDGLSTAKRPSLPPDTNEEMGEFEDEWEDDLESDEGALDGVAEELEGVEETLPLDF